MSEGDDIPEGGLTPGDIVKNLLREWGHLADITGWTLPSTLVSVGDTIAAWLAELPGDTVMWSTTSGRYTASDLIDRLDTGDGIAEQYANDLLRIAFDLIRRRSNAATTTVPPQPDPPAPGGVPKLGVTNIEVTVDVGAINDPGVDYAGSVAQLTMFGLLRQAACDWDLWGVLAQRPDGDWRLFDAAHLREASEWGSRAFVVTGVAP